MSDQTPYTPSLDEVRDDYVIENMRGYDEYQADEPSSVRRARYRLRFDRLIAQVRAEAWDEGRRAGVENASRDLWEDGDPILNPYRARRDR